MLSYIHELGIPLLWLHLGDILVCVSGFSQKPSRAPLLYSCSGPTGVSYYNPCHLIDVLTPNTLPQQQDLPGLLIVF